MSLSPVHGNCILEVIVSTKHSFYFSDAKIALSGLYVLFEKVFLKCFIIFQLIFNLNYVDLFLVNVTTKILVGEDSKNHEVKI